MASSRIIMIRRPAFEVHVFAQTSLFDVHVILRLLKKSWFLHVSIHYCRLTLIRSISALALEMFQPRGEEGEEKEVTEFRIRK